MFLLADTHDMMRLMQRSVWSWVALVVVLLLLAGVLYWVRSRFLEDAGPAAGGGEMLSLARNLHLEGDLTEEEFRSIKGRLLDLDGAPTAPSESTPDSGTESPPH